MPCPSGVSLERWGANVCGPKPLLLREKLGGDDFIPVVEHCAECGVYGENVSQSLLSILRWVFSQSLDM